MEMGVCWIETISCPMRSVPPVYTSSSYTTAFLGVWQMGDTGTFQCLDWELSSLADDF